MTRLPVHERVRLATGGEKTVGKYVRCPEDGRWTRVEACRQCPECAGLDARFVTCAPAPEPPLGRSPEEAPVVEVMDMRVLCIEAGATVENVARALDEEDVPIALVVDAENHTIGVCSRRDLVQRAPNRRVTDCMTPFLVAVLETARVSDAVDLLVDRGLSYVPVLGDGRVLGVVTPRAVIRWLAQNLREARSATLAVAAPATDSG